ncbi:MAG: DMT family transporter [Bacillus sp. (in: firmicutes)]
MNKVKGYSMVVIAAFLWGVSGAVAQKLFAAGITVEWLVTIRLISSGLLILLFASFGKGKTHIISICKHRPYLIQMVIFGIIGMVGVQYTFFLAIDESNAAVATLLQYIAPVFIAMYFLVMLRMKPSLLEMLAMLLALAGTFLLLTNGSVETISITPKALSWGLLSAVALAFYTVYSGYLVRHLPSIIVVGFGMLIGGLFMCFFQSPFAISITSWNSSMILLTVVVIIFGTIVPFFLFMDSMRYISPKEASLLGCTEPLSAIVVSVLWLHTPFGIYQAIGSGLILAMVLILAMRPAEANDQIEAAKQDTIQA